MEMMPSSVHLEKDPHQKLLEVEALIRYVSDEVENPNTDVTTFLECARRIVEELRRSYFPPGVEQRH